MAEGTKTYEGLAAPLFGEYEQEQQTAATDMVTLTGASAMSGDFLVCQTNTGTENVVISSSGLVTSVVGITGTIGTFSAESVFSGVSGSAANAIKISVTSTGAIAADAAANANAILVQASSKSAINAVLMYDSVGGATSAQVNSATALLGTCGTTAPTYFLTMGGTGNPSEGPATAQKMLSVGLTCGSPATKTAWAGLKCLFGSKAYYILASPDTGMS